MASISLAQLGTLLKERRATRGVREVARDIDISPATLSRVENGKTPDLDTFEKICRWLGLDPGEVLGFGESTAKVEPVVATAHLRAKREISPELARALGEMVQRTQSMFGDEPAKPEVP